MLKLLIADSNSMICERYAQAFSDTFCVHVCYDGIEAAEKICQLRPDFVILDLMLPGKDGITVLQECARAGVKPLVLATAVYINHYIQSHLENLDIEYLMCKPCDLGAVVSCISDFRQQLQRPKESVASGNVVTQLLISLNFASKLCGYRCLHSALLFMLEEPDQSLTKELYPAVAAIHGGTAQRVERAIRTAIQKAWENRDDSVWKLYFPAGKDGSVTCPTNGAFLSRMCCCLLASKSKAI